jgi:hypothetical protein
MTEYGGRPDPDSQRAGLRNQIAAEIVRLQQRLSHFETLEAMIRLAQDHAPRPLFTLLTSAMKCRRFTRSPQRDRRG